MLRHERPEVHYHNFPSVASIERAANALSDFNWHDELAYGETRIVGDLRVRRNSQLEEMQYDKEILSVEPATLR